MTRRLDNISAPALANHGTIFVVSYRAGCVALPVFCRIGCERWLGLYGMCVVGIYTRFRKRYGTVVESSVRAYLGGLFMFCGEFVHRKYRVRWALRCSARVMRWRDEDRILEHKHNTSPV